MFHQPLSQLPYPSPIVNYYQHQLPQPQLHPRHLHQQQQQQHYNPQLYTHHLNEQNAYYRKRKSDEINNNNQRFRQPYVAHKNYNQSRVNTGDTFPLKHEKNGNYFFQTFKQNQILFLIKYENKSRQQPRRGRRRRRRRTRLEFNERKRIKRPEIEISDRKNERPTALLSSIQRGLHKPHSFVGLQRFVATTVSFSRQMFERIRTVAR